MSLGPFEPHVSAFFSEVPRVEIVDIRSPGSAPSTATAIADPEESFPGAPTATISAELIRSVLMGLPVSAPDQSMWRAVSFACAGVGIRNATITGELNLEDLAGAGGGPLPALQIEECWFHHPLNLKRCHLRSLSLKKCRLKALQAAGAIIDGQLNISHIRRPAEIELKHTDGGIKSWGAWVVLTGARIGGYINCGHSSFASVPRDPADYVENSKLALYALDLRASRIGGSVRLRPNVEVLGGVSFNLATVKGSILCNGAHLTATEDCAFSADYSNIHGSLYLRAYDSCKPAENRRFEADGQVSLFAARVGGTLYMEGADLKRPTLKKPDPSEDADTYQSVDATNATIGGNCKLCCWHSFTGDRDVSRFSAAGRIILNSAVIRNDLSLAGAEVHSVYGKNIEVGGECRMSVYAESAKLTCRYRMSASAVHFEGAFIKGDLLLLGAQLGKEDSKTKQDDGLFARGAKINGNCHISTYPYEGGDKEKPERFECYGRVHLQEASIGNSLVMAGSRIIWPEAGPRAVLDFSGTTIGGHAKLWTWQPEGSGGCLPFTAEGGENTIRMAGTRIAQKLIMNGAVIHATRMALYASNIEVGGQASLSVYSNRLPGKGVSDVHTFRAHGNVVFAAAIIKMGLNLRGGQFLGSVSADYARIGAHMDLTRAEIWCSVADIIRARIQRSHNQPDEKSFERRLSAELAHHHAGKFDEADLSLRLARIDGALIVSEVNVYDSPEMKTPAQTAHRRPAGWSRIVVDLRGLHVDELRDEGGEGWRDRRGEDSVMLRLDGFSYARLSPFNPTTDHPAEAHATPYILVRRLTGRGLFAVYSRQVDEVWRPRKRWLELQFANPRDPQRTEFTPGAYEQVVKVLNADGLYEDARKIASAKLSLESKVSLKLSRKVWWGMFGFFFDYGMSPLRAFLIFAFWILLGTSVASMADARGVLVPRVKNQAQSQTAKSGDARPEINPQNGRCNIEPILYAFDVFVPGLNLAQETACNIRSDRPNWRHAQALYSVLGWILTPLTLLTFSGILKRQKVN